MNKKLKKPLYRYMLAASLAMVAMFLMAGFFDNRPPIERKHNVKMLETPVDVNEHVVRSVVNGSDYKISDLKGEMSVLAFWAPWCGYCKQEFPQIDRIHHELARRDIKIIPIVKNKESRADVESFYRNLNLKNIPPFVSNDQMLYVKLSVRAFPTFILLDKQGMAIANIRPNWTEDDVFDLFTKTSAN